MNFSRHVRRPEVPTRVPVCELLVVEPHKCQERVVKLIRMHTAVHRLHAELVS